MMLHKTTGFTNDSGVKVIGLQLTSDHEWCTPRGQTISLCRI